ncbi:hypothetical protein [Actinoplanes sp. NPDC051851]|uniref:hypothetical protein n=1 Tax=Actinoplanes sp. NPDC051851 TaxID=3154753 RepID=UPI00341CFD5B
MTYPADSPVTAVHIVRDGEHYRIDLRRADGSMSVVRGGAVPGGLRKPGDVLVHLLAEGVPVEEAEHCVGEIAPGFNATAELARRPANQRRR